MTNVKRTINVITFCTNEDNLTYNMLCVKEKIINFFYYERGNTLIRVERGLCISMKKTKKISEEEFFKTLYSVGNDSGIINFKKVYKGEFSLYDFLRLI